MKWTKVTNDRTSFPPNGWYWLTIEWQLGGTIGNVRGVVIGGRGIGGWADMLGKIINEKVISWAEISKIPKPDLT